MVNNRLPSERVTVTGNIFFIKKEDVPSNRKVSYTNYVCNIRPHKTEIHRVCMTAGGNYLDYPGNARCPVVCMLNSKLHINITISDAHKGACYLGIDIKNFYLFTLMQYYQYIRFLPKMVPQEVWDDPRYDIPIATGGFIYLEIRRGMYGLTEAGVIAFDQIVRYLAPHGYETSPCTPGLWCHTIRPTTFTLCVDDFGVKYVSKEDAHHLVNALKTNYEVITD